MKHIKNTNDKIKRTYILNGLDCANCAQKIEEQIQQLPYVIEASVFFAQCKLTVFYKDEESISYEKQLKQLVKKIEPHVDVCTMDETKLAVSDQEKKMHKKMLSVMIGILFFVLALYCSDYRMIQIFLYFGSYGMIGYPVLQTAVNNMIRRRFFDEYFLMTIATLGAFAIGEYSEAIAVMLFYRIGEYFQSKALYHSRQSIGALLAMKPEFATVVSEEGERKISPEQVGIGDIILVKPGEKIPIDGIIVEGESDLDVSALTGESMPKYVICKDKVLSGSVNGSGILKIKVTTDYENSTLAKILEMVEHAANKKTKTEAFMTKFARYYTPVVVGIAFLLAFLPPILFAEATFSEWLYRALVFLVISCPCALVISIPLGYFSGIGALSKNGILIKGSRILEDLTQVSAVVFDKTGTLTKGTFQVLSVHPEPGYTTDELLKYAAYGEIYSNHPIAQSIRAMYTKPLCTSKITDYQEESGNGVVLFLDGQQLLVGNEKMLRRHQVIFRPNTAIGTIVYVAYQKKYIGSLVIGDELKPDAKVVVQALKKVGVQKTVMLSGDTVAVAQNVAYAVGLDEVYGELLPNQKLQYVENLCTLSKPQKVVFVGDGMNDTPALARADIGIAMGGMGSDAAVETADIVLMHDEVSKIALAIQLARKTKKIIWQNIVFAFGVKAFVLILGALGIATLWEAVFADMGVSVLAILNALRILKNKFFTV